MASHNSSEKVGHADALVCRSAALLLRAGHEAGLAGHDLAAPLERLLSAVSLELETGRGSMPPAVRCAAIRLAEHVVQRSPIPVPRLATGGDEPVGRSQPDRCGSAAASCRSTVPFTRSIRLGRMG